MDTPESKQLNIVIPAYRWHSQTFLNVLDGISEQNALKRIDGKTNHVVWMAGNFVNTRYSLGWVLGLREEDPYSSLFFQAKALDERLSYPSLQQLKESFHKISPLVYQKLLAATDEQLEKKFPIGMDVLFFEENILNFTGMSIGRADYLCGQMGLMRRMLGYEAMRYDVDENLKY
ncbi:MAG: DinB family protein [Agriterribacter sp.]